ncbi:ATP phosphoribosyltransferase [Tunicatimonas pelagia]|uniref:ATP phosphoribosyltransferase n=1 Tax=Tunicatimonas pelagia TaxID=931531 RepID=UPI0026651258|nr:ATP phosphoribosyltransferase [Tunicatimonas pelagia]WKN43133.1 ATP phosphoribosyltransferase [Tunicatimonas pelagia]
MKKTLRIAIQKSGRLSEQSVKLINECGIHFNNGKSRLKAVSYNFPAEFLFLRDDDIPGYVEDGVADLGIVGENEMVEKAKDVLLIKRLGFSKCRLSLAIPRDKAYTEPSYFQAKNIATSYPRILHQFLKEKQISAHIHEISGSVEIAPSIGLADAVCDIVSSGSTLLSNGLKEVETIFRSEAVLLGNHQASEEKKDLIDQLVFRINSVQAGKGNKYILLNAPKDATEAIVNLLPGMRSPTIVPLAMSGWNSIHSVVQEDQFWEVIEKLREAGAEGILVVPIEKMIL